MSMLLENKNAIIYGAGGSIGSAAARAFARNGARVFLAGRTRESLERVATDITADGGQAEVDVVDALDEAAVDAHAASVVERGGSLDVSFNLATRGDIQGIALAEMSVSDLLAPVISGVTSTFVTARAAARHMVPQGSGVILALNSGSAQGSPMMGGTGPADAATDTLIRNLASELGPSGVRVVGIWAAGIPETLTIERMRQVNATIDEGQLQAIISGLDGMRALPRSPRLDQVVETVTFLASDGAGGITGTFVNVTGGLI